MDAGGAHDEGSSDASSVYDAAGGDEGDFNIRQYIFQKGHEGEFSIVATGFHAFHHQGIGTGVLHPFGQFHVRHHGNAFHAGMVEVIKPGHRIPCTQGDEGHLFIADDLGHVVFVGGLEHEVYAIDAFRTQNVFGSADIVPYFVGGEAAGTDDPCAACMGHGGSQDAVGNIGHASLNNGIING